jgi:hypothetical protein
MLVVGRFYVVRFEYNNTAKLADAPEELASSVQMESQILN